MLSKETKIKKYGNANVIVIPQLLNKDSQFPFKLNEKVIMEINDNKLIIKKIKDGE